MRHLELKKAIFHSKALEALRACPAEAKDKIGLAIFQLQQGHKIGMPLSRPMPSVALGVEELRVKSGNGRYRVFYYVKSVRGILILHVFEKRTQKTTQHDIEIGRKRLKEIL